LGDVLRLRASFGFEKPHYVRCEYLTPLRSGQYSNLYQLFINREDATGAEVNYSLRLLCPRGLYKNIVEKEGG